MDRQLTIGAEFNGDDLDAVSCGSPAACVAVGSYGNGESSEGLAETWNGVNWSASRSRTVSNNASLDGVSCTSARSCTAVGAPIGVGVGSFAEQWDGSEWSYTRISPLDDELDGISCVSRTGCVAVGLFSNNFGSTTSPLVATSS